VIHTRKRQGQDGVQYEMVDGDMQRRSMGYLARQVFETPEWLLDADILRRFEGAGAVETVGARQASALNQVLNVARMNRLVEQEEFHGGSAYSLGERLDDLRASVWSEATNGEDTDAFRRNLQRAYLDRVSTLLNDAEANSTDVGAFLRGQLMDLQGELDLAQAGADHRATMLHFQHSLARIQEILEPNGNG